jgi:hypothetical protein
MHRTRIGGKLIERERKGPKAIKKTSKTKNELTVATNRSMV